MPYTRHAYILVFDGFADHETALALRELHAHPRYGVIAAGFDRRPVTAASGLRVLPEITCEDIRLECAGMFMLPGGALWEHADREDSLDTTTACVGDMLQSFDAAYVPVAAIGSATAALARAGLLDGTSHTSNGAAWLETHARHYERSPFYVDTPAIADNNVITANGAAPVEYAFEIIRQLGLRDEHERQAWLERNASNFFNRLAPRRAA